MDKEEFEAISALFEESVASQYLRAIQTRLRVQKHLWSTKRIFSMFIKILHLLLLRLKMLQIVYSSHVSSFGRLVI